MIGQYEQLGVNKEMEKSREKGLGVIIWVFYGHYKIENIWAMLITLCFVLYFQQPSAI